MAAEFMSESRWNQPDLLQVRCLPPRLHAERVQVKPGTRRLRRRRDDSASGRNARGGGGGADGSTHPPPNWPWSHLEGSVRAS